LCVIEKNITKKLKNFSQQKTLTNSKNFQKASQFLLVHNVSQHLKNILVDKDKDYFFHNQKPRNQPIS